MKFLFCEPNINSALRKNRDKKCAIQDCDNLLPESDGYRFMGLALCEKCGKITFNSFERIMREMLEQENKDLEELFKICIGD